MSVEVGESSVSDPTVAAGGRPDGPSRYQVLEGGTPARSDEIGKTGTDTTAKGPASGASEAGAATISPPPAADARSAKRPSRRLRLIGGAAALAAALCAGFIYWDNSNHYQSTDDAFVAARQFGISAKVSGYVTSVPVTDNEHVKVGQVLTTLDQRDYKNALAQARAQVSSAQATIRNTDAQLAVQKSQIEASQAQVEQAQAALLFAKQQAARYDDLAKTGSGTVQNEQQFVSQLRQATASLQQSQAALNVAQETLNTLGAQREGNVASLAQAEAQRDQAELNLSYTTVVSAQAGRMANLTAATGQYLQAGTALSMFVPDEIWITANFKETQLDKMRPGQPVTIRIDAYPSMAIRGRVASLQSGSGTAFSLLPAENATGNYVKVVQRVPVKIVIDNPPTDLALGPGMSVVPTVRVDDTPSIIERIRNGL
jgi:membrane fusion protein, multidrug efflux system